LAEVTVPYTDAREGAGLEFDPVYRFYYETTHWVINVAYDRVGEPWYILLDDKWDLLYYVLARHIRLVPNSELQPISPEIPMSLKRIEVHLEDQLVTAYEVNQPVFMARAATGGRFRDGNYSTKPGRYLTFHKRPSRHMAAGNLAANGYDLPGVPWICYITESGISFHGTYWHNNFGRPRSHGCINLTPQAARWLYLWTLPTVPADKQLVYQRGTGTAVDIYEW
jgi:L,D-transpeptidase catalytic domain